MAIFKKQGVYWIDYYFQGTRKREKVGTSRSLAGKVLIKRQAEIAEARYFPERQRQAVAFRGFSEKYWNRHWQYLQGRGGRYLRERLEKTFGEKNLSAITVAEVQDFYNATRTDTSVATANRYSARLSHMFEKARLWGDFFGVNPVKDLERGREDGGRVRFLTMPEIGLLLAAAHPRIAPILTCALHTGMRRGEILGLQWENVNLEQGVLYIVKSKSGKPREIPISPQLGGLLLSLGPRKAGPIFEIPIITLRRMFDRAIKAAKVTPLRFHDLRHTFASHFVMRTGDLPSLQQLLGHFSLKMTQRYAHLAKGHLASGIQLFASAMPVLSESSDQMDTQADTNPILKQ
jgi:integrase